MADRLVGLSPLYLPWFDRLRLRWCKDCPRHDHDEALARLRKPHNPPREAYSGNKRQARARVNYLVKIGKLPRPADLPCRECGAQAAHYDHHLGYDWWHHEDVIALCAPCHARETWDRSANESQGSHGPYKHDAASSAAS